MRTTLNIDDELLIKAKGIAARERTSLTRVIEEGLALRLRAEGEDARTVREPLPVHNGRGGLDPRIGEARGQGELLDAADGLE